MNGYITSEELLELGVELTGDKLQKVVDELNDKIDELVGEEIVDSLTPDDVDTLAEMQDSATEQDLANWVIEHVPDYPEIIENNKDIVLGDFVETIDNKDEEDNENE
jgi:hypothetical protein